MSCPANFGVCRRAEAALVVGVGSLYQIRLAVGVVIPYVPREAEVVRVFCRPTGTAVPGVGDVEIVLGDRHPDLSTVALDGGGDLPVLR